MYAPPPKPHHHLKPAAFPEVRGPLVAAAAANPHFLKELAKRSQVHGKPEPRVHVFAGRDDVKSGKFAEVMTRLREIDPKLVMHDARDLHKTPMARLRGPMVLLDDPSRWLQPAEWLGLPDAKPPTKELQTPLLAVLAGPQVQDFRRYSKPDFDEGLRRVRAFVSGGFELFDAPQNADAVAESVLEAFTRP